MMHAGGGGDRAQKRNRITVMLAGPLLLWAVDLFRGLRAGTPIAGLLSYQAAVTGILTSAGVYLIGFATVRAVLEAPRWALQELLGAPVSLPHAVVAAATVLILLWLNF